MPREALRENLKKLHSELASVDDLDEELQTLLQQTADDIEEVLGDESARRHSGGLQLDELALRFEADHPRLASILRELGDTLSKLGI